MSNKKDYKKDNKKERPKMTIVVCGKRLRDDQRLCAACGGSCPDELCDDDSNTIASQCDKCGRFICLTCYNPNLNSTPKDMVVCNECAKEYDSEEEELVYVS